MKKMCSILTALLMTTAFALPISNPAEPSLLTCPAIDSGFNRAGCFSDWLSLRSGFYGDYVFNRYLQVDASSNHSNLWSSQLYTNGGYFALNICNRLDLNALLGATFFHVLTPSTAFRTSGLTGGEYLTIETNTSFSWGLGGQALLFSWRCFDVGLEGGYFSASPNINYVKEEADVPLYVNGQSFDYSEWQVGIALSRTYWTHASLVAWIPYLGLKWAWAQVDMENTTLTGSNIVTDTYVLRDLESSKLWGYAVGLTMTINKMLSLSAERRFGDENGLQVNGQIHF